MESDTLCWILEWQQRDSVEKTREIHRRPSVNYTGSIVQGYQKAQVVIDRQKRTLLGKFCVNLKVFGLLLLLF